MDYKVVVDEYHSVDDSTYRAEVLFIFTEGDNDYAFEANLTFEHVPSKGESLEIARKAYMKLAYHLSTAEVQP